MSDDNNMATSSLLPPTPPIVDDAMTNPPKAREPVQDALFEESNSSNGGEHHSANTPERTAATPEVCRSLFIENLHPECEFTHLYHYFSRFGEVSSVRILRDAKKGVSRGIGYVNFSHCEDAHEARAKTDGATAIPLVCRDDAQPLHIRYADQEQAARHDDSKLFTLHYLPAFVTRAELLNVLAPFGDVVECNILSRSATRGPVKGSAIEPDAPNMEFNVASIEFSTSIAATRAACRLHRSCPFGPHPLHVKPDVKHTAPPRPTPGPHAAAPASSHRPPLPSYSKSANLQQPAALLQPTPQQRAAMVTAAMAPNSALQHHSGHYLYPHMQLQIPAAVQPFAGGFPPLGPQGAPMFQTMTPQFVYMTENGPVLHTAAAPHPGWPHVTTLPTAAYGMPPSSMTPMQAPSFVSLQTTPTHPFHMMAPSYPVFQYAVPPVPQAHAELFVDSNAAFSAPAAHQAP